MKGVRIMMAKINIILRHFWPASTAFAYGSIIPPKQVILQEKFQNFLIFFCLEKGEIPQLRLLRLRSLLRQGFRLRPKWIYQGTTPDKTEGRHCKQDVVFSFELKMGIGEKLVAVFVDKS